MISEEVSHRVRGVLAEMNPRDRDLLRAIFLDEKDKQEVCVQLGIARPHLRVLLHRAKERFRSTFARKVEGRPGRNGSRVSPRPMHRHDLIY